MLDLGFEIAAEHAGVGQMMDIRALAELFMVAVFAVWLAILTVFMAHSLIWHIRAKKRAWEREIAEDLKRRRQAGDDHANG